MGGKSKRASKSKSDNVGANAAGKASSSSVVGAEKASETSGKRRQLGRRDSSEKVERQLRTHFASMSRMEMANKLVDGKNVRQQVAQDRDEFKSSGKHRMGANYWRDLASRYGVGADFGSIALPDDESSSRKSLIECLQLAVSPNCAARDSDGFGAYLTNVSDLTAKEIIGIARTLSASQGIGKRAVDKLWCDLGGYLCRTHFRNTTAEFQDMFRKVLDQVMERTYLQLKKNHVKLETFMNTYDGMLRWLFKGPDYQVVSSCNSKWNTCIPQLQRLAKVSDLGETLYSFVFELLNAEALCTTLCTRLQAFDWQMLTEKMFTELQGELMSDLESFSETKALHARRNIEVEYYGHKVTLAVLSPTSEMHLRLMAVVKERLISAEGGLEPLIHEAWVPCKSCISRCLWDEALLMGIRKARKLASEILEPASLKCTADIAKLLAGSRDVLLQVDNSFGLEVAWAEQALPGLLAAAIHQDVWQCLPTKSAAMSMSASLEKLEALSVSKKVQLAARSVQDEVMAAVEAVSSLVRHQAPTATAGTTPYISRLLATLQFFIRHPAASTSTSASQPPVELVGKAALKAKLEEMKVSVAGDENSLTLSQLTVFQSFKYLLDDGEKLLLDSWMAIVLQRASAGQLALSTRSRPVKAKKVRAESSGIDRFF